MKYDLDSLKMRLLSEVVRRLSAVPFQPDLREEGLYHFGQVSVRIVQVPGRWACADVMALKFQFLQEDKVLLEETATASNAVTGEFCNHPLNELLDLVRQDARGAKTVAEIANVNALLAKL